MMTMFPGLLLVAPSGADSAGVAAPARERRFATARIAAWSFRSYVHLFDPRAADNARGFKFHPDQVTEDQPDGSLIVHFDASGWMEMCWHLYQWGDAVEVLEPKALREMVEGYRRSDFYPVLP